jgi:hypothetical protein
MSKTLPLTYFPCLAVNLVDESMLRNKIMMRKYSRLGETGSTTTKQSRSRGLFARLFIVESHPVLLTMAHKLFERPKAIWQRIAENIEDPDTGDRNLAFVCCCQGAFQHLGLGDDEFTFGGLDVMHKLELSVRWISSCENTSCGYDA